MAGLHICHAIQASQQCKATRREMEQLERLHRQWSPFNRVLILQAVVLVDSDEQPALVLCHANTVVGLAAKTAHHLAVC